MIWRNSLHSTDVIAHIKNGRYRKVAPVALTPEVRLWFLEVHPGTDRDDVRVAVEHGISTPAAIFNPDAGPLAEVILIADQIIVDGVVETRLVELGIQLAVGGSQGIVAELVFAGQIPVVGIVVTVPLNTIK